jgi:predicted secreted protein
MSEIPTVSPSQKNHFVQSSRGRFYILLLSLFIIVVLIVLFAKPVLNMGITGAISLYFVLWWVTLFLTLPIGVQSQAETGEVTQGTEAGAPHAPHMLRKAIYTTYLALPLLGLAAYGLHLTGL